MNRLTGTLVRTSRQGRKNEGSPADLVRLRRPSLRFHGPRASRVLDGPPPGRSVSLGARESSPVDVPFGTFISETE